jgi:hypothetical protein
MKSKKKVSDNRKKLLREFRKLNKRANQLLDKYDEWKIINILDDDYGGIFSDKDITTNKNRFRNNPSQLSNKKLENRIGIMKSLIEDDAVYQDEAFEMDKIARNMEKWQRSHDRNINLSQDLSDFFTFAKAMLGDTFDPSNSGALNVAERRLDDGESIEKVKNAFYSAWLNNDDVDSFIHDFSEQGIYL